MRRDEWSLEANLARGSLPTGEPLEALYGAGPWTRQPEQEPEVVQCEVCGGSAYDMGDEVDCVHCDLVEQAKAEWVEAEKNLLRALGTREQQCVDDAKLDVYVAKELYMELLQKGDRK